MDRLTKIKEMLVGSPEDSFLIFAYSKELEKLDDSEGALESYLKLRRLDPDYTGLYYHLGKLYESMNSPSKAIETYNEGIEICKKQSDFHALSELNNALINLELED